VISFTQSRLYKSYITIHNIFVSRDDNFSDEKASDEVYSKPALQFSKITRSAVQVSIDCERRFVDPECCRLGDRLQSCHISFRHSSFRCRNKNAVRKTPITTKSQNLQLASRKLQDETYKKFCKTCVQYYSKFLMWAASKTSGMFYLVNRSFQVLTFKVCNSSELLIAILCQSSTSKLESRPIFYQRAPRHWQTV